MCAKRHPTPARQPYFLQLQLGKNRSEQRTTHASNSLTSTTVPKVSYYRIAGFQCLNESLYSRLKHNMTERKYKSLGFSANHI